MAGASLFALLDDIAALMDDIAVMTKTATSKTAGVIGDDLALNAYQVNGVTPDRELPVVWAVAKGSAVNKLILIPSALAIGAFLPWLVTPLLMIGGLYLCFEGVEKLAHKYLHKGEDDNALEKAAIEKPDVKTIEELTAIEKEKIRGAIRTDFILSAEIIVLTLGAVAGAPFGSQVTVMCIIGVAMTIGVYGLVAGIVKMDDAGLILSARTSLFQKRVGRFLLAFAPVLLKILSIAGTIAMFTVGGGILVHGIPGSHDFFHMIEQTIHPLPLLGGTLAFLSSHILSAIGGVIAGILALAALTAILKAKAKFA